MLGEKNNNTPELPALLWSLEAEPSGRREFGHLRHLTVSVSFNGNEWNVEKKTSSLHLR